MTTTSDQTNHKKDNLRDEVPASQNEESTEIEGSDQGDRTSDKNEEGAPSDQTNGKDQAAEFKEKYLFVLAEMDNLRKRLEREKGQSIKFANESLLQDLVEVVDNFERTTSALSFDKDEKIKNIVVGIQMVHKQFLDTLARHGLEPILSVGRDFDPNFHEAVGQEVADGKRVNEVIKEYQGGYLLNGRLLRPSKVVVAQSNKE